MEDRAVLLVLILVASTILPMAVTSRSFGLTVLQGSGSTCGSGCAGTLGKAINSGCGGSSSGNCGSGGCGNSAVSCGSTSAEDYVDGTFGCAVIDNCYVESRIGFYECVNGATTACSGGRCRGHCEVSCKASNPNCKLIAINCICAVGLCYCPTSCGCGGDLCPGDCTPNLCGGMDAIQCGCPGWGCTPQTACSRHQVCKRGPHNPWQPCGGAEPCTCTANCASKCPSQCKWGGPKCGGAKNCATDGCKGSNCDCGLFCPDPTMPCSGVTYGCSCGGNVCACFGLYCSSGPPCCTSKCQSVGGIVVPVDKFGLLAPYIGLASTTMIGAVATAVYIRRVKRRKEKQ